MPKHFLVFSDIALVRLQVLLYVVFAVRMPECRTAVAVLLARF